MTRAQFEAFLYLIVTPKETVAGDHTGIRSDIVARRKSHGIWLFNCNCIFRGNTNALFHLGQRPLAYIRGNLFATDTLRIRGRCGPEELSFLPQGVPKWFWAQNVGVEP